MKLLGDLGHVESSFGPFGDSVSIGCMIDPQFTPNVP
jgi:hypothetical protein